MASMLFGMFFGAGSLIFSMAMGQNAGSNLCPAILGFVIGLIIHLFRIKKNAE